MENLQEKIMIVGVMHIYKDTKEIKSCNKYVQCDNCEENKCDCDKSQIYCGTHLYFEDFTNEEIESIKNNDGKIYACGRCNLFISEKPCCHCQKKYLEKGNKKRKEEKENRIECCNIIKESAIKDDRKCTNSVVRNIDELAYILDNFEIDDEEYLKLLSKYNIFCKIHIETYLKYMYDDNKRIITKEEYKDFKWCSGCRHYYDKKYFSNKDSRCLGCLGLSKKNNEKIKIEKKMHDRCKYEDCEYEALKYKIKSKDDKKEIAKKNNLPCIYGDYCGKHQVYAWKYITEKDKTKKVCDGWKHHGCRVISDSDKFYKCNDCNDIDYGYRKCCPKRILYLYKLNAKNRNLEYKYDDNEFKKLFYQPCFYCGIETNSDQLNGVDRSDNSKGYVKNNCVTCCSFCNFLKRNMETDKFMNTINHILSHIDLINKNKYESNLNNHNNIDTKKLFEKYKKNANERGYKFIIDIDDFIKIIENDCYLCGKKTNGLHKNGIDRIDNNEGYELRNVLSCCGDCNLFKHKYDINDFIYQIYKIYTHTQHINNIISQKHVKKIIEKHINNELSKN